MKIRHIVFFLICLLPLQAYSSDRKNRLIEKYENDTISLKKLYSDTMINRIKPAKGYVKWQINKIYSNYTTIRQYPLTSMNVDTVVMSKPKGNDAFWELRLSPRAFYLSVQKGEEIHTITNLEGIDKFIGKFNSIYDALFWLQWNRCSFLSIDYFEGKEVKEGYLFRFDYASSFRRTLTYLVTHDKEIIDIKEVNHL